MLFLLFHFRIAAAGASCNVTGSEASSFSGLFEFHQSGKKKMEKGVVLGSEERGKEGGWC